MTLMEKLRSEIKAGRVPPIFNGADLQAANIDDPNHNLSNYDKRNSGSLNKKVLVSRIIKVRHFIHLMSRYSTELGVRLEKSWL